MRTHSRQLAFPTNAIGRSLERQRTPLRFTPKAVPVVVHKKQNQGRGNHSKK